MIWVKLVLVIVAIYVPFAAAAYFFSRGKPRLAWASMATITLPALLLVIYSMWLHHAV